MNSKSLAWHVNLNLDPDNNKNGIYLYCKLQENDIHFGFIPFKKSLDNLIPRMIGPKC